MADIFYFNSPRKPAALLRTHPTASSVQATTSRKRRITDVEMFSQRACVPRYQEPVFYPRNISALISYDSSLHVAAAANSNDGRIDLNEEYDDDDDDDSGGVSLLSDGDDHIMTYDFDDVSYTGPCVHTIHGTRNIDGIDPDSSLEPSASVRNALSIPGSHNRPSRRETSDIENYQAGRRARHALEGNTMQYVAQHDPSATLSRRLHDEDPAVLFDSGNSSSLFSPPALPSRHDPRMPLSTTISHPPLPINRILTNTDISLATTPHDSLGMPLDDDAVGVDDPQRSYDFADFMDIWRLRSLRDKRLPPFEPGLQPSVRLGRPREVTRKQVQSGTVDMQGLPWKLIGPHRDHVISARAILHPSKLDTVFLTSSQGCYSEERQYRFCSHNPRHKAKFNHYQLRNLLAASSRNDIFYATGNQVQSASHACPEVSDTVMDLSKPSNSAADFRITCLSASSRGITNNEVLLAGGFYGEFAALNLDSIDKRPHEGFVTHSYNGLVTHIHNFADRRSGLLQAAFCSNDRSIRLMDVGTMRFTDSFLYDSSVNCSATSPDGRLRVLVGDSQEVLITDASQGHCLMTLQDQNDHGFACDWSPDSRYVAAAAQDGKTVVWDARNWAEPVRTLHGSMSCARSLHFTDDGALIVAENDDVVSIFDSGSFEKSQDIQFFGSIAGVALLKGSSEMVIANADKTVGGILTFERSSRGNGNGTFGRCVAPAGSFRRLRGRKHETSELEFDMVV